jgi:hypothetical protein
VRLIRGETPTAGDLSTLRSITALGEGEEPARRAPVHQSVPSLVLKLLLFTLVIDIAVGK